MSLFWIWAFITTGVAWSADECTVMSPASAPTAFYFPEGVATDGAVVITDGRIAATYSESPRWSAFRPQTTRRTARVGMDAHVTGLM